MNSQGDNNAKKYYLFAISRVVLRYCTVRRSVLDTPAKPSYAEDNVACCVKYLES